ncbi:hypothetical protein ACFVGY_18880 [Streptomyces sp. NPDC127106]|uniref:hypothetical protein n=1 Tax=Streptomyces sp. NPDC127106 TaxID=3345360 RepID=UPI00362B8FAD
MPGLVRIMQGGRGAGPAPCSRSPGKSECELWQLREYAAPRSLHHLEGADAHLWVIPRLTRNVDIARSADLVW